MISAALRYLASNPMAGARAAVDAAMLTALAWVLLIQVVPQ